MDYIVLDLRQIRERMGNHYDPNRADEIEGQCPVCAKDGYMITIPQDTDTCFTCGTPVVWKGSKLWKRKYGSPTERIRELTAIPPSTKSGKHLMKWAGMKGWPTQADAQRWQKAVRIVGESAMTKVAQYVTQDKGGHPALRHAINIAKNKARSGKREDAPPRPDKSVDDLNITL